MGRESCSIQRRQKPVEAVAFFEVKTSISTMSVIENKEVNMTKSRSIRSAGVSISKTEVSVKAKVTYVFAAALLVMTVVGDHSA